MAVLKDVQISIRFNSSILEEMRKEARAENISLSDLITRLFQSRGKDRDIEARLSALEHLVNNHLLYKSETSLDP